MWQAFEREEEANEGREIARPNSPFPFQHRPHRLLQERSSVLITKTQLETCFYHGPFDTETFFLCMTK